LLRYYRPAAEEGLLWAYVVTEYDKRSYRVKAKDSAYFDGCIMCKSAFVSLKRANELIESLKRWQLYCEEQGWKANEIIEEVI
jgi:hypothetical protein